MLRRRDERIENREADQESRAFGLRAFNGRASLTNVSSLYAAAYSRVVLLSSEAQCVVLQNQI